MNAEPLTVDDPAPELVARIPPIVDLDDHVLPYVRERADDVWETHRGSSNSQLHCPQPPSTYYYRQVSSCFFKDPVGVGLLDEVGVDNVVFETDYPHQDGTWPHSREVAASQFGHLDATVIDKIARRNAIRLLGLDL